MRHAITSLNHNIAPLSSFILRGNSTLFTLPKNATPHRMTHLIRRESACQCPLSQDKFSIIEPFFFQLHFPGNRCQPPGVAMSRVSRFGGNQNRRAAAECAADADTGR